MAKDVKRESAWVVYLAFVHLSLLLFWMSTVLRPSERKTKNVQKECEASPQFKLKSGSKSTSQNYDRSPKPLVCKREWCEPFCSLELYKVVSQLMKITTYCRILQCIVWPTMWLSYIILACCTVDPPWHMLMTLKYFEWIWYDPWMMVWVQVTNLQRKSHQVVAALHQWPHKDFQQLQNYYIISRY